MDNNERPTEPPSPRNGGERVLRPNDIGGLGYLTICEFGNVSAHEVVEVESDIVLFLKKFFES